MYSVNDLIAAGVVVTSVRGNEEILGHCPFHKDIHPSFSANLKKGVYLCFSCGESGRFSKLGLSRDEHVTFDSFKGLLSGIDKSETPILKQLFSLPYEFKKFNRGSNNPSFYEYLMERGIKQETIEHFGIGYCESGIYRGRIIVPLPVGFVARSIYNDTIGKRVFGVNYKRYLFPLGLPISNMLFNFSLSSQMPILVEGTFDALRLFSLGFPSAISSFSCKISEAQIKLLCKSSSSVIYIFFDDDVAGHVGMKVAEEKLRNYFKIVRMVRIADGKDPGNLESRNEVRKLLRYSHAYSQENEDYDNLRKLIN
jgi:DNA primase